MSPIVVIAAGVYFLFDLRSIPGMIPIIPGLSPTAVAVDKAGNLYIAEHRRRRIDFMYTDHRGRLTRGRRYEPLESYIWKMTPSGRIERFAGTSKGGFGGDGGLATSAQLFEPRSIAVDHEGSLYMADNRTDRIRKVDRRGIITTVQSIPPSDRYFPGVQAIVFHPDGTLYVAACDRVWRSDSSGFAIPIAGTGRLGKDGDGGPAIQANIGPISSIAFDRERNLWIATEGWERIRKVNKHGIIETVIGGNGRGYAGDGGKASKARLMDPRDIKFDKQGNLYIAEGWNSCLRKVNSDGIIRTIAGMAGSTRRCIFDLDGQSVAWREIGYSGDRSLAINAQLAVPVSIAIDAMGNIFIADSGNHCIRRIDRKGIITTVLARRRRGRLTGT